MDLVNYNKEIEDYSEIIGVYKVKEIKEMASKLQGERIVMVNSTPSGGGVAEILISMTQIMNNLGLKVGWRILKGPENFFQITKKFHNSLQGEEIELNNDIKETYEQVNYENSLIKHIGKHDLIVIHDPQPLPLINFYKKRIPWIWRCHIDFSKPNPELLDYLKQFINKYDSVIVSTEDYKQKGLNVKQIVFPPSIDPLTLKNREMSQEEIIEVLEKKGIKLNKPIITQVSRFDKWKDPIGVVNIFKQIRREFDCQLVLLGNLAIDDPEGPEIYKEVTKETNGNPDITVLMNCDDNDRTVNALQRASHIVIQNSIKEGFALTVSEALWKETVVVSRPVGGIPLQIIDGKTGFLYKTQEECVKICLWLLKNDELRKNIGKQGKEHVRNNFLITRHVLDYLKLFDYYLNRNHKFNVDRDFIG